MSSSEESPGRESFVYSVNCPPGWDLEAVSFIRDAGDDSRMVLRLRQGLWKASLVSPLLMEREGAYRTTAAEAVESLKKSIGECNESNGDSKY